MSAIIKRELKAYFTSPLGYVILGALLLFSGLFFSYVFSYGYADMTYVFSSLIIVIFFITPILTMRSFSEEKNKKTDQLLFTSPVKISSIVLGKFFSAVLFFGIFIVAMVLYNLVFMIYGATPDWTVLLGNIVGITLFTSALISIGIFISALTESQVVAAVSSFAISFFLIMLSTISSTINNAIVTSVCNWISFSERYNTFSDGVFDIANVIFFLSVIAIFLFLTVRVIDRKRWA